MADILENPVDLIDDAYEQEIQVEQEPIEVVAYRSYNQLDDKPQINGVELVGNKTSSDLGITEQINSAVNSEAQTRQQADSALQGKIDAEELARQQADSTLQGKIDAEETARKAADKDIQDVLDGETLARQNADTALGGRIDTEIHDRQVADIGLQGQIDAITSKSDVVDVIANYAALQAYDTQHLGDNDVIKVLDDETHGDALTYYRWSKTNQTWSYIGQEAPYYSKGQTETLLLGKQDKIDSTNKLSSDLVDDSNATNKFVTSSEKTSWNSRLQIEVIESLPAQGEQNKLYLAPTPHDVTELVSGNPIEFESTNNTRIGSIKLSGNRQQQTYTGKNLFNKDSYGVINAYVNSGGILTAGNGTVIVYIQCSPNTTYTVSKTNAGGNPRFCVFDTVNEPAFGDAVLSSVGTRSGQDTNTHYTITTGATAGYLGVFCKASATTLSLSQIVSTIQIEEGSSATSYEPYVGGMASPNPSYPQQISVVKNTQTLSVTGKNLFDKDHATLIEGEIGSDMKITSNSCKTIMIRIAPNTDYIASKLRSQRARMGTSKQPLDLVNELTVFKAEAVDIGNNKFSTSITSGPEDTYLYFTFASDVPESEWRLVMDSIQIEKGDEATAFSAYYPPRILEIDLGNIELRSAYDYIFNDGATWKVHETTAKYVMSGDEVTDIYASKSVRCQGALDEIAPQLGNTKLGLSNNFTLNQVEVNVAGTLKYGEFALQGGARNSLFFRIDPNITTVEQANTWFANHRTEVIYQRKYPVDTEITDNSLISQLNTVLANELTETTITISTTFNEIDGDLKLGIYELKPMTDYTAYVFVNGKFEDITDEFTHVAGGYVLDGGINPNNPIWSQWSGRLGWGMDTANAIVPAQFNGQIYANGTIIAHNAGDRAHNRHALHVIEAYAKDDYSRLTMLTDKHNDEFDGKKSFEAYYYTGASHKNSAYGFFKVGSDVKYHSFLFDRDKMIASGVIDCRFPITLARINPSTDLDDTYSTVEAADTAYEAESRAEANIKCIKYLALKNAQDGAMWYDTARNKIVVKINGEWHDMNTTAVPEGTYDF